MSGLRRYFRADGQSDILVSDIGHTNRFTVLSCISAGGIAAVPLFIFKGIKYPYRQVVVDGRVRVETFLVG